MLPAIPKLTNVSKSTRQPLPDKMNKKIKRQTLSCINKQQDSKSVPHEIKKYTHI